MAYKRNVEIFEEAYTKKEGRSILSYESKDGKKRYISGSPFPDGGAKRYGTTDERPNGSDIYVGFHYFDTTLGQEVIWDGTDWIVLPKYEVVAALPSSPDSNTLYLIEES